MLCIACQLSPAHPVYGARCENCWVAAQPVSPCFVTVQERDSTKRELYYSLEDRERICAERRATYARRRAAKKRAKAMSERR